MGGGGGVKLCSRKLSINQVGVKLYSLDGLIHAMGIVSVDTNSM